MKRKLLISIITSNIILWIKNIYNQKLKKKYLKFTFQKLKKNMENNVEKLPNKKENVHLSKNIIFIIKTFSDLWKVFMMNYSLFSNEELLILNFFYI